MTPKGSLQRGQQRQTLFAECGQVAANARKGVSTRHAAKAAGDLLLHLDHAQIPLSQVVVKIHAQIFQKAEDGFLVDAQAVKQISGGTLWAAALFPRGSRGSGSEAIPFIEQAQEVRFPIHDFPEIQTGFSQGACLFGGALHIQQQVFEVGGPPGVLFFGQKDQFPQHMHQAEGMLALVQEIRPPAIMDGDPVELRQNPNRVQGLAATARIDMVVREGWGAGGMHPRALALHIQPGFILMDDVGLYQGGFDVLLDVRQIGRTALDQGTDGAFAHLDSQQVLHDLCGSRQGHQLLLHQIHRHRSNRRSILHGGRHLLGKTGHREVLAHRTLFVLRPIFLHQLTGGRYIMDLSAFHTMGGHVAQIVVTGFALLYRLLDDLIGGRRPGQARPPMSLLPTRFLLAFLPQAFRLTREPIRRRRQAAIVAVFGLSLLQRVHLLRQALDMAVHLLYQDALLFQRGFQLLDSCIALRHLFSQALIFFFNAHACTLPGLPTFGKPLLT